ncbi:PABP-interacting PAM2 motif-containing protein [Endozoicomonas sp. 4G]|uniref:PABP-interacting PAM2 motif-containing protein n=1 Tax=Endozoicomonas sp. 4G TaxID=2872754 RepID=UPI0020788EEC|nr:PABP-interacting PAM2 motif-containing protein [Endozoicomonas sp. 4G]
MNYGLPPAYSNAPGATPSQSTLPDSNKQTKAPFKLNPDAPVFVPRRQHAHQPSISPQNILHRQTTAYQEPSSQTLYPPVEKESPKKAKVKINRAYSMLSRQNFIDAENTFRSILHEYDEDSLATFDYQRSVIGLARSLNESNEKQKEARLRLEKLRSEHDLNEFGASTVRDLDLTLSLSEERLGRIADAQARLLKLREKQPDADEETLCQHSRFFDADMAQVRLWKRTGKLQLTEKLLLSMKKGLTSKLDLQPHAAKVKKLQDLLHTVNITQAQFWRETGQYKLAEDLILQMSDKHSDDSIEKLCKSSKNNDVDLSLVRIWEATYQYKLAEKLLLNIIDKQPDDDEEILCTPSGKQDIDIALARLWQLMRKHKRTEILLLNMSNKNPGDREDILCRPSGNHDIDLNLVRQWEIMDKNHLAKKLIERCYALYRSSKFQLALLCLSAGKAEFMEIVSHLRKNAVTLLAHSIHYFNLACQQINDNKTESGKDSLNKALEYVQSTIEKYPQTAGAYAQKAHIIRMLGASDEEWQKLFDTADTMDGERNREKDIRWRREELAALKKIEAT